MYYIDNAGIAQSVEQRTENPCVTSSNLVPGKLNHLSVVHKLCHNRNYKMIIAARSFSFAKTFIRVDLKIMDSCSS